MKVFQIIKKFVMCGATGWCIECFWTGLFSIFGKDRRCLPCKTSLWMFPIYGLAVIIKPLYKCLCKTNVCLRGIVYATCIYGVELCSGLLLKKFKCCPWDYSKAKLNYKGVIRLDYAPAWFITGLLYEHMLNKNITL